MSTVYDLIIIGGGPAGYSAAIYAGRAMLNTLVIEKDGFGGQIGITNEIVNYPGIENISGAEFMAVMKKQIHNFGVEYRETTVTDVALEGVYKKVSTTNGDFEALAVIVATGAKPRKAGFEGEDKFRGRGVGYCATCDGQFFQGLDIFVIGGSFAAAEEAIFLTRYAKTIHLIVRKPDFTCSKTIAEKVLANKKIQVHFNTIMTKIEGETTPASAHLTNTKTNEQWVYKQEGSQTFGTFVFTGYEPVSSIFKGKLVMTKEGYIITNENMETNIPGVYAAGDIRPKKLRQLVTASADGAIASTNAEKYIEAKKETLNIISQESNSDEDAFLIDDFDDRQTFFNGLLIDQLKPILSKFENHVRLVIVYDTVNQFSSDMKKFVLEFTSITDKVSVDIYEKGENPAIEKKAKASLYPFLGIFDDNYNYMNISYHAVPSGHEFNSFVLVLYNTAGPGQELSTDVIEKIQNIQTPTNIKVGISLTCTMCPDVVMSCQLITKHNKNVEFHMIDIAEFPEFRTKYNIMSVPAIVINDEKLAFGKKNMNEILALLEN